MAGRKLFFLSLFLNAGHLLFGQVSGVVRDPAGNPVAGANVFVNRSSLSAVSGPGGRFALSGIEPGFSEVIGYKKGYKIFRSTVRIQEGLAVIVPVKLAHITAPHASRQPLGSKSVAAFHKALELALIGPGDRSDSKILNQDALQFYKSGDTLKVAADPIEIANPSSGSEIWYYREADDVAISAMPSSMVYRFDSLRASDTQQLKAWQAERERIFMGSLRHLLSSLVRGESGRQGFTLRTDGGKILNPDSLLGPVALDGYSPIKLKGRTKVEFKGSKQNYVAISYLITAGDMAANSNGLLRNDNAVRTEGNMNVMGLANLVPIDFYPSSAIRINNELADMNKLLQEKIFVQTDKPYYYRSDTVWFKGYVNYYEKSFQDSLSKVAYLELISPEQKIIATKILRIDQSAFSGDLTIGDSLPAGNYQLRAYTSLMRNFSRTNIFRKTVRVLTPNQQVDHASARQQAANTTGLVIKADRAFYKVRDKINLFIQVPEDSVPGKLSASVSVTDDIQVVPVEENVSIEKDYLFSEEADKWIPKALTYPAEEGITFTGQCLNDQGNWAAATITMLEGGFGKMARLETNEDGSFTESGFQFYDSMAFSFLARDKDGKYFGTVVMIPKEVPPVIPVDTLPLHILKSATSQRPVPHNVITLKPVDVTARKISRIERALGPPQRIIDGSKLKGPDLASALIAAIPTLKTFSLSNDFFTRYLTFADVSQEGRKRSMPTTEIRIYVNDRYRAGGPIGAAPLAINALTEYEPSTLDHVEVYYSGVIALYMQPNAKDPKTFQTITLPGFSRPHAFNSPDHSKSRIPQNDFRSTIFWEPDLSVSGSEPAQISFYAADLPGQYHVVLEGVTAENKPVHGEYHIEIRE